MIDDIGFKSGGAGTLSPAGAVAAIVATLGEIGHDGEIIARDAIARDPGGVKAIMSRYNHDTVMGQMLGTGIPGAAPVGKGAIRIEGDKAVFRGTYFMETDAGKQAFLTTKAMGDDARWSFAYGIQKTAKPSPELAAKGARRILVKLGSLPGNVGMEVSPVNMPGGVGTATLDMHSLASLIDHAPKPQSPDDLRPAYLQDRLPEPWQELLVERLLPEACEFLGLSLPAVRWFDSGELAGQALPGYGEVWLNRRLDRDGLVECACHEVAHLREPLRGEAYADATGRYLATRWIERRSRGLP